MNSQISINELAHDIKAIYASDPAKAETLIEGYLADRLKGLSPEKKLSVLAKISSEFTIADSRSSHGIGRYPELLSRLYSLLLGKETSNADLSSEETLERLCGSLNTVFDRLNELIDVINTTLLGKTTELETIRRVIGSELERVSPSDSLENYLNQIKEAFLATHNAFKQAAYAKLQDILTEIDPAVIETTMDRGLKFGPLRKAKCFEVYQEKFKKLKNWYESGRFMEELSREFEKKYQKLYLKEGIKYEKM